VLKDVAAFGLRTVELDARIDIFKFSMLGFTLKDIHELAFDRLEYTRLFDIFTFFRSEVD
jgi:hypothetical protein